MARRNLSDLLQNRFECSVPWETMSGEGAKRFCGQCQCHVFDLAQMEPRAVKARLEAHRGQLCARITRKNGQIQMLAPKSPEPPERRAPERAPAIAAGLLSTWLVFAAQSEASPPLPAAALVLAIPTDPQGEAGAASAAPEEAKVEDYAEFIDVDGTLYLQDGVTAGGAMTISLNFRELFEDSELVVIAKVGESKILSVEDGLAEVHTQLRIARRFKGEGWERELTFRHSLLAESVGPGEPEVVEKLADELLPGNLVLAFLGRVETDFDLPDSQLLYETTSYYGVRRLEPDEADAYSEMLDELAQLRRMAGTEGELDPAGLMEWLVATTENPFTRTEQVGGEILTALEDLEEFVAEEGTSAANLTELGANFTEDHRLRLSSALLATQTVRNADLDLYRLVKELDPETAKLWRIESLNRAATQENVDVHWWLTEIAEAIGMDQKHPFFASAAKRVEAIDNLYPVDGTRADEVAWEHKRMQLGEQLVAELAALYAQQE